MQLRRMFVEYEWSQAPRAAVQSDGKPAIDRGRTYNDGWVREDRKGAQSGHNAVCGAEAKA